MLSKQVNEESELNNISDDTIDLIINCELENKKYNWPTNLKYLKFQKKVDNYLVGLLPDSIEKLKISLKDNSQIEKWPSNLKIIEIFECSTCRIIESLPDTLEKLTIGPRSIYHDTFKFPSELKILLFKSQTKLYGNLDNLPHKLEILDISSDSSFNKTIDNLPESLKILYLSAKFNHRVENLPEGLKELVFGGDSRAEGTDSKFNQHLNNLPKNLEYLVVGRDFNQSINELPDSIKRLALLNYNYSVKINKLPKDLEKIWIYSYEGDEESYRDSCRDSFPMQINYKHEPTEQYNKEPSARRKDFNYVTNYLLHFDYSWHQFIPRINSQHLRIGFVDQRESIYRYDNFFSPSYINPLCKALLEK